MSSVNLAFDFTGDARAAVDQFLASINQQISAIDKTSNAVVQFNEQGEEMIRTYKIIKEAGEQISVTVQKTAQGFELISAKVDAATSSLKEYKRQQQEEEEVLKRRVASASALLNQLNAERAAQEQAQAAAARRTDANAAESSLGNLLNRPNQNVNQINAAEAALQKIRQAIESGAVSLQRFQQIFNTLSANPKAILPNLTAEEAQISKALRTMIEGFDKTGDKAQRAAEKISISWQGMLRLFEAQVIKRATSALESALLDAVKTSAEFSIKIAEIETISQKAGLSTEQWSSGIRGLSEQFGRPQTDVAEAAYQAISNQVTKGAESFEFLATALKFGKATVSSAADSVNLLSSALKSYSLPASDAERVSAIFFKTIELGRVRASDLANTFGNVSSLAAEAGVKLEEVGAAIAVLTSRGILPNTAQTLITNVIQKLIRPTEEMKKLLDEWGVSTGQAAIQTFGFAGVLQKLDAEAQKGTGRLGELFNQIRALRGVAGLTGGAFGDFNSFLEQITGGQGEFDKAGKLIEDSFGERLKKQLNEARVYFAEFGDVVVKNIVQWLEYFGGFRNVLTTTFNILKTGAIVWTTYRTAVTAANVIIAANAALTTTSTSATNANTLAATTNATAMEQQALAAANLQKSISLFAAAFSFGVLLDQLLGVSDYLFNAAENAKKLKTELERIAQQRFVTRAGADSQTQVRRQETDAVRDAFTERFRLAQLYNAEQLKLANDLKQRTIDNLKDATDRLKVYSKGFFDTITKNISDLRERANEAKNLIKESLKVSEDIPRKSGQTIFDNKLKFANDGRLDLGSGFVVDDQKSDLIKRRINELSNLARDKFKEGTKESVEEARKLFGDVEKLTGQLFDQQTANRKREFEEAVRTGKVSPTGIDVDPLTGQAKARFEFVAKTADFEKTINTLAQERLALESKFRSEQEARQKAAEADIAAQKERLRTIQQSFEAIEKISVFDKSGKVKSDVKKDPSSVLNEFDRQAQIIKDRTSGEDLQTQIQLFSEINRQRLALSQQVNAAILQDELKNEEAAFGQKKKNIDLLINKQVELQDQGASNVSKGLKAFEIAMGELEKTGLTPKFSEDLKRIENNFAKNSTPENLAKIRSEIQNLLDLNKGNQTIESIGEKFNAALKEVDFGLQQITKGREGIQEIEAEGKKFGATLAEIPGAFDLIAQRAAESSIGVQDNIQQVINKVDQLVIKVEEAANRLQNLNAAVPAARGDRLIVPDNAEGRMFGGLPKYLSAGGFVNFVPRGSDQYPAMLARNEMVMTEQATAAFMPVLKAMNAGIMPKNLGNNSVTNVGDINVSVHGGNTSDATIKNIAKGIRRGIQRGTIQL